MITPSCKMPVYQGHFAPVFLLVWRIIRQFFDCQRFYMFTNQLLPVIAPLSADQRKVLVEFIELLSHYNISEKKPKDD